MFLYIIYMQNNFLNNLFDFLKKKFYYNIYVK